MWLRAINSSALSRNFFSSRYTLSNRIPPFFFLFRYVAFSPSLRAFPLFSLYSFFLFATRSRIQFAKKNTGCRLSCCNRSSIRSFFAQPPSFASLPFDRFAISILFYFKIRVCCLFIFVTKKETIAISDNSFFFLDYSVNHLPNSIFAPK